MILPKNFDWRNDFELSEAAKQGKCENCWVYAITTCFSDIINIRSNGSNIPDFDKFKFAEETVSDKNNICMGGTPVKKTLSKFLKLGCCTTKGISNSYCICSTGCNC